MRIGRFLPMCGRAGDLLLQDAFVQTTRMHVRNATSLQASLLLVRRRAAWRGDQEVRMSLKGVLACLNEGGVVRTSVRVVFLGLSVCLSVRPSPARQTTTRVCVCVDHCEVSTHRLPKTHCTWIRRHPAKGVRVVGSSRLECEAH